MNVFDIIVLVAAALAVLGGWRLGLITRALGWVGAVFGLVIGVTLVPALARWINPSSDSGVLLLTAGSFILLASAGQALGVAIGSRLRPHPEDQVVRRLDSIGGSSLGLLGVVVMIWLLVPLMAQTNGWVSSATRTSALARAVTDHLPDPPSQVTDLERSLVDGNFPQLFTGLQPAPDLPPPPKGSPVDGPTLERVAASTARVQGQACALIQSGSSFSVGDGLWITNAHVVAGTRASTLTTPDGTTATGRVVAFDPRADVAVLRSDLSRPALPLADPKPNVTGLVLGFPGGGPFEPSPFLLGEELTATGYDIYDRGLVRRELLVMAADLQPGDSGSPVVDADGHVLGISVAVAPDRPGVAYALDPAAARKILSSTAASAVDTGSCLN